MLKKCTIFLLAITILISIGVTAAPQAPTPETLDAKAAILMEAKTGKILFEKNIDSQLAMASITKTMLLLITMEQIEQGKLKFDDFVVGSQHAKSVGGSTIFLEVGEQMTVNDILKGICINSGNDATVALAEKIAGSEDDFVKLMNERAKTLGLKNTNFVNATGIDAQGHYSCARDIAMIAREILLKHRKVLEYSGIWMDTLRGGKTGLANTNKLLKSYQYATGLKTGSETNAGYCVAATAKKDDMELIAVILGSSTTDIRFKAAQTLLEYGYDSYEVNDVAKAGDVIDNVKIIKGDKKTVPAILASDLSVVIPKNSSNKLVKDVNIEKTLRAPIAANTKVGTITVKLGDTVVGTADVIIKDEIKKITFWQAVGDVFKAWFKFSFK